MSRRYQVTPIADADISAQCRWFMDRSVAVAKKFLKAVHQTILNIAENPSRVWELRGDRRFERSHAEHSMPCGSRLRKGYRVLRCED